MECRFCKADCTNDYMSPSGRHIVCLKCFKEKYFTCPVDYKTHSRSAGVLCGYTKKLVYRKNIEPRKCSFCESDFFSLSSDRCTYIDGMDTKQICHKCDTKHKRSFGSCEFCGKHFVKDKSMYSKMTPEYVSCDRCFEKSLPLKFTSVASLDGVGRTVGVEVECEPTVDSQIEMAKWMYRGGHMVTGTTDESLRGRYRVEYVSPIMRESNYEDWLDEFGDRIDARVYNRCGLHVHVSTADFTWSDINHLMMHCRNFEANYYSKIVSPSRVIYFNGEQNNAGLPMPLPREFGKLYGRKSDMMIALYGERNLLNSIKQNKRANDGRGPRYNGAIHRYQWLNIHGHFFKKAVEIRLHHGTTDKEKIRNWIALWLSVVRNVKQMGNEAAYTHPAEFLPDNLKHYYEGRMDGFKGWRIPTHI